MSLLGLYLGPKSISLVNSQGKKLLSVASVPHSLESEGELEEKVPQEVKAIEIVALLKDELRRGNIAAKELALVLSGKDLTVRTFEVPRLSQKEMASAISFEAKKYIPYRVEDVVSDFQAQAIPSTKTNLVLYVCIKKDVLDRYLSIATQLGMKVSAIEYAAFSTLRLLSLRNIADKEVTGVVSVDTVSDDDASFVVLENGVPLFSRDFSITHGQQEAAGGQGSQIADKVKSEVRLSLDYYRRKFPAKSIKKICLFCNPDKRSEIEASIIDSGISVSYIDMSAFLGAVPYASGTLKAYAGSLRTAVKSGVKLDLLAAKARVGKEMAQVVAPGKPQVEAAALLEGFKINYSAVLLGIGICVAAYFAGLLRLKPVQDELVGVRASRPAVTTVNPEDPLEALTTAQAEYQRKLSVLDVAVNKKLCVTAPLDVIPRIKPAGVWLTDFDFTTTASEAESTVTLMLNGMAYLDSGDMEYQAVQKFVAGLKADAQFVAKFPTIQLSSVQSEQLGKVMATAFRIKCEARKEGN